MKGSFAWQEDQEASLNDVDLDVPAGSLVAIVGSTGGISMCFVVVLVFGSGRGPSLQLSDWGGLGLSGPGTHCRCRRTGREVTAWQQALGCTKARCCWVVLTRHKSLHVVKALVGVLVMAQVQQISCGQDKGWVRIACRMLMLA